jgi:hypothetical protein
MPQATPAKIDDSATPISFPAVGRKKLTAAFDGGRLTSDGGVLLLAQAERAMGICGHVFWRSAVAMKTRTTSTCCVMIQAFVWPWANCPVRVPVSPANRP